MKFYYSFTIRTYAAINNQSSQLITVNFDNIHRGCIEPKCLLFKSTKCKNN